MSKAPLTLEKFQETLLKEMGKIHSKLTDHDLQFTRIDKRFADIDTHLVHIDAHLMKHGEQFAAIRETLSEHDELLETIAAEVSRTQDTLIELRPSIESHETRITRLEYGMTKLLLKS